MAGEDASDATVLQAARKKCWLVRCGGAALDAST
jgi:hypothetical protein